MGSKVPEAEEAWLAAHYAEGTIHDTLDAFEEEFGWRPTKQTVYMRANKAGLRKRLQDPAIRTGRAQMRIAWSKEPEMEAWMLEHDTGGFEETVAGFEERFGIRLSRGQISLFRAHHGTQKRDIGAKRRGGRPRRPVGYERETKGGILVKVAEEAEVPMSKDNWRFKHVIAYERAYGPVPGGCTVMAVDGDKRNCDPANLVACPKKATGALNQMIGDGASWEDRDGLIALIGIAALKVGINDAEHRMERTCGVCGKPFCETDGQRRYGKRLQTCPECLAAGRRTPGKRCGGELGICEKCGAEYPKSMRRQRFCRSCSTARYRR